MTARPLCITVIGAGLMGHGIAQVFARAGNTVVVSDPNPEVLAHVKERIAGNLALEGADTDGVLRRVAVVASLSTALKDADFVIEAAPEKLPLKQHLFAEVSLHAPPSALLASNTSVIPITSIGRDLPVSVRERLVGTHWWNPPHLIPLVEVVRSEFTRDDFFERAYQWLLAAGKRPVKVNRDVTGFIGNRLQHALWREAIHLIEDGVCDAETIDLVVKNSFGMRMAVLGPMENADLVGLELTRDIHEVMFPELHCDKQPSKLLNQLIGEGHVGMRSGRGLRRWTAEEASAVRERLARHLARRD